MTTASPRAGAMALRGQKDAAAQGTLPLREPGARGTRFPRAAVEAWCLGTRAGDHAESLRSPEAAVSTGNRPWTPAIMRSPSGFRRCRSGCLSPRPASVVAAECRLPQTRAAPRGPPANREHSQPGTPPASRAGGPLSSLSPPGPRYSGPAFPTERKPVDS